MYTYHLDNAAGDDEATGVVWLAGSTVGSVLVPALARMLRKHGRAKNQE